MNEDLVVKKTGKKGLADHLHLPETTCNILVFDWFFFVFVRMLLRYFI